MIYLNGLNVRFRNMWVNVLQIGDVVDFGTLNCQPCTKLDLKTKIIINQESRHIAYVLL
jgi:hypothetical protein